MGKSKGVVLGEGFVNRVGPAGAFIGAREGYAAKMPVKPMGYNGTVNSQFEGDQSGNRQTGLNTGTPFNSEQGNPDEASRVRFQGRYGVIDVNGGQDMNSPSSNGNGVVLDGMNREKGYQPRDTKQLDSPVPSGAPFFDTRTIAEENRAHLGGDEFNTVDLDDLGKMGGVMSRGMVGTSRGSASEDELLDDDYLKNPKLGR
jgi:hypothetical protein